MDMTLAEMDFFGKRRSFWQKKRIRKILIFKYSNWEDEASGKRNKKI
jgi:hypothetical protein